MIQTSHGWKKIETFTEIHKQCEHFSLPITAKSRLYQPFLLDFCNPRAYVYRSRLCWEDPDRPLPTDTAAPAPPVTSSFQMLLGVYRLAGFSLSEMLSSQLIAIFSA
ncbi:hypothetical protein SUGI_0402660 [Cryptomeria japonica]|nr:hypothetical protein SUGI_0402660 [Cryptomeria japonica]